MTRVLAQRMSQDLGQPFVVEGKPGANGQLGAAQVARAPNDGYTLFLASVSNATNVAITPSSATDLAKELTPIALVANVPSILVVHPSLGVANVQELIALAKAKPDQLFFGSVGVGSPPHLAGELFKELAGVKLTHVPYAGGSGQAATDLIAGRISMMFSPQSTIAPHINCRHRQGAGRRDRKARRPVSRPADDRGSRPARFQLWHLGRANGAGRHAASCDRPARARSQRCAQDSRGDFGVAQRRHRSARRHAGGLCPADRR